MVAIAPIVKRHWHPTPPAPAPAPEISAELPYAELKALAEQVESLQHQGRYGESLPGARALLRQHELHGRLVPEMLVDYARMLNNAAFEAGVRAPRSSLERITLERQSLEACRSALAMAKTPREHSEAITMVGLVHEAWGFPYDAYLTYRAAVGTDPTYPEAKLHLEKFLRRLNPGPAPASAR